MAIVEFAGTAGTATIATDATWTSWVSASSNVTVHDATTWRLWCNSTTTTTSYRGCAPTHETPEARAARQEAHAEEVRRRRELAEANVATERRAEALLRECLTAEQLAQLAQHRWFEVVGQSGKRYRLGLDGQTYELADGCRVAASFCIHPDAGYPLGDVVLARKLLLEADERLFLATANRTPRRQ